MTSCCFLFWTLLLRIFENADHWSWCGYSEDTAKWTLNSIHSSNRSSFCVSGNIHISFKRSPHWHSQNTKCMLQTLTKNCLGRCPRIQHLSMKTASVTFSLCSALVSFFPFHLLLPAVFCQKWIPLHPSYIALLFSHWGETLQPIHNKCLKINNLLQILLWRVLHVSLGVRGFLSMKAISKSEPAYVSL